MIENEANKHNDPQPNKGNDSKGHNGKDNDNRGNHTSRDIKAGQSHGEPLCMILKSNQ